MPALPTWASPQKPAELTYHRLVQSILDGSLPANSLLPNEHELADALGVTRSTLREALQKLSANGLVEIQHGRPTRVRDIWLEGNMNTLATLMTTQHASLTARWVPQLLAVRADLAPQYTWLAVSRSPGPTADMLAALESSLEDTAAAFATADWRLHHQLTVLSGNPIYTLILNGFREYYHLLAETYFGSTETRAYSRQFYRRLQQAAETRSPDDARQLVSQVMAKSIQLWEYSVESVVQGIPRPEKEG